MYTPHSGSIEREKKAHKSNQGIRLRLQISKEGEL